jgi:hypothetical protein
MAKSMKDEVAAKNGHFYISGSIYSSRIMFMDCGGAVDQAGDYKGPATESGSAGTL